MFNSHATEQGFVYGTRFHNKCNKGRGKLLDGYQYFQGLYQEGIDAAAEENDKVTEDMFIGFNNTVEKNIWMISAVLNKAPEIQ